MEKYQPIIRSAANDLFKEYMTIAELIRRSGIRPDFVIGDNYIKRWWLAKIESQHEAHYGPLPDHCRRTTDYQMYLHCMTGSDDDRAMHDHVAPNASLIWQGSYIEHTPIGAFIRKSGDVIFRQAEELHRLELNEGPCWTLFVTSKKIREWGFMCEKGWVHWKDFTGFHLTGDAAHIGPGCGD